MINPSYFPTVETVSQLQDTFGFAHDMDLREPMIFLNNYQSRLGADVGHKFYNAPQYGGIFAEYATSSLRAIFQDLADPDNYPMYMYCTWGRDRTGTIIFLLQGLLNVSQEDMVLEYNQSAYVHTVLAQSRNMDVIIQGMESFEGDTLQEKIVTYLTTVVGVTEEEIASIRAILLENPAE